MPSARSLGLDCDKSSLDVSSLSDWPSRRLGPIRLRILEAGQVYPYGNCGRILRAGYISQRFPFATAQIVPWAPKDAGHCNSDMHATLARQRAATNSGNRGGSGPLEVKQTMDRLRVCGVYLRSTGRVKVLCVRLGRLLRGRRAFCASTSHLTKLMGRRVGSPPSVGIWSQRWDRLWPQVHRWQYE